MKRRGLALFAGLLLLGLLPGSALATPGIDQSMETCTTGAGGTHPFGQTFTAGMSGTLTSVDLKLTEPSKTTVTVSVRAWSLMGPTGLSLASTSTSVSGENWYSFLFHSPPTLAKGHLYAIIFDMHGTGSACGAQDNKYLAGEALVEDTSWGALAVGFDFAFRTYMLAPLPTPTPSPVPTPAPTSTPAPTPTPAPPAPPATHAPTLAPGVTVAPAAATASSGPTDASGSAEPGASDASGLTASPTAIDSGTSVVAASSFAPGASPAASSSDTNGSSGSGPPLVLAAIVALAVVLVVGGGVGFLLWRRRRPSGVGEA